jgi:hypothetical protein
MRTLCDTRPIRLLLAFAIALVVHSETHAQNTAQKILVGDSKVTVISSYSGKDKLPAPSQIVLHDFDVPSEIITIDHSAAANILGNGPLARRRGTAGQDQDPAAVAQSVQAQFANTLLSNLQKTPIPVTRSPLGANAEEPAGTLIIRGDFTAVQQGNKTARIMIGLGRGASDVEAHVIISLLTPTGPLLLSEFNVNSASGKKPGAAATMGVGSAATSVAASGGTDHKATVEGDTSRLANAVAKEVRNIMTAQQWLPPADADKQSAATQSKPSQ